jgi:Fic family protein
MPGLYRTAEEKKEYEARNGVIQARAVAYYTENWHAEGLSLTPDLIKELQRLAINQIYSCAGTFRNGPVKIQGVDHQPPDAVQVVGLVEEMCGYVLENWGQTPVFLAAYLMWRLNWIHPFFGGNGRTSRAVSYLILGARLGFRLPGEPTIPDQIEANPSNYYNALKLADQAWFKGSLDVSAMESLLASMLAKQLVVIHDAATGRKSPV